MKPKKEPKKNRHSLQKIQFNSEVKNQQSEYLNDLTLKCPQCSSENLVKHGKSRGKPLFKCKDCERHFIHPLLIEQSLIKKQSRIEEARIKYPDAYCYHCHSDQRNFTIYKVPKTGKTRFYCIDCQKTFTEPEQRFFPGIVCPKCNKCECRKSGKSQSGKQKYYCFSCHCQFVENPSRKYHGFNLSISDDVWDARELGVKIPVYKKSHTKFVFTEIEQPWLKDLVKKFIKFRATTRAFGTLSSYMMAFRRFSQFLKENHLFIGNINQINRELIIEYIHYLNQQDFNPQTVISHLGAIKLFFEDGNINRWFKVSPYLIRLEDYPKSKKPLPRYIPEEVVKQLNQHIDKLPEQIMRMVLILQECGLRIGEALTLSFDCLRQDAEGDWFLFIMRNKPKKEQNLPISRELVAVIQEQQEFIRKNLDENFNYLFCGRQKGGEANSKFLPEAKVMTPEPFSTSINRLAKEKNITKSNGTVWRFQSHQFRHTVGTRMINNNVPQHIVQKYLGHESPTMTMRYAHIHDQTLKREIAQFHDSRVVNVAGEVVKTNNAELDKNLDLHLFKKNVLAQALSDGSCARPIQLGECPHANACLTCGDFRTTLEFLDQHKTHLMETEKLIKNAEEKGWKRQVEMNVRVRDNLKKIITTLESEDK